MTWEEWRFNTRFAWENPLLRWASVGLCVILMAVSAFSAVRLVQLGMPSGFFVTHYTVYLGIDQMAPLAWLAAVICVPILLIFGTIACAFTFFRQDNLAGYALLMMAAFSTLVWSYFLFQLAKINS
jgi:hypothetical protein